MMNEYTEIERERAGRTAFLTMLAMMLPFALTGWWAGTAALPYDGSEWRVLPFQLIAFTYGGALIGLACCCLLDCLSYAVMRMSDSKGGRDDRMV